MEINNLVLNLYFFVLIIIFNLVSISFSQQQYENNAQLNCEGTNSSSVLGYTCNSTAIKTCTTYLLFRTNNPSYNTPVDIAYLLSADARNISALNSVIDVAALPPGRDILVPVTCTCQQLNKQFYYQHNASYTIKYTGETYLLVANDTFGGLSTCQALISQNPYAVHNLTVGDTLTVPLRCACPSAAQRAAGFRYLLTYAIARGDDVPTIADRFKSTREAVLEANSLSSGQTIYYFNTLLVPLSTEPTNLQLANSPSPSATITPSPPANAGGSSGGGGSNKGVGIGIGVGAAVFGLLCFALLLWWIFYRRRRRNRKTAAPVPKKSSARKESSSTGPLVFSNEIRSVMESLPVYKFHELEKATGFFDEEHRIKGSVYRSAINGDTAAIKRVKGDVAAEIGILKNINHSSIIRLSGVCFHEGFTYLVYEYAGKGSLADTLHDGRSLSWNHRVQIAYGIADGLNYLHNYTNPPYVHKNLKSSNILLDGEFRAKIANFGLARPVNDWESLRITKHVVGTQGYMAPEYLEHGLVTTKLDVFAFGVVMLELLSGKEAAFAKEGDEKGEVLLWQTIEQVINGEDARSKFKEFMDPCMNGDYPFEMAFTLAQLARHCVSQDPSSRPTMDEILVSLSAVFSSTLDWDPSDVSNSKSAVHGR